MSETLAAKQSEGGEAMPVQRFSKQWRMSASYGAPPQAVVGKYELPNGWCCMSTISPTPSAAASSDIGPATAERHGGQPASVRKMTGTFGAAARRVRRVGSII